MPHGNDHPLNKRWRPCFGVSAKHQSDSQATEIWSTSVGTPQSPTGPMSANTILGFTGFPAQAVTTLSNHACEESTVIIHDFTFEEATTVLPPDPNSRNPSHFLKKDKNSAASLALIRGCIGSSLEVV